MKVRVIRKAKSQKTFGDLLKKELIEYDSKVIAIVSLGNKEKLKTVLSEYPEKKVVQINNEIGITKSSNKLLMKTIFMQDNIKSPEYFLLIDSKFYNHNEDECELPFP